MEKNNHMHLQADLHWLLKELVCHLFGAHAAEKISTQHLSALSSMFMISWILSLTCTLACLGSHVTLICFPDLSKPLSFQWKGKFGRSVVSIILFVWVCGQRNLIRSYSPIFNTLKNLKPYEKHMTACQTLHLWISIHQHLGTTENGQHRLRWSLEAPGDSAQLLCREWSQIYPGVWSVYITC